MRFLAQDPHEILRQVLPGAVGAIGNAFHPHRPGQSIGTGQCNLHRTIGLCANECQFVAGQRPTPSKQAEDRRVPDLVGRDIEGSQLFREVIGVVHQGQKIGQWDQLAVVQDPTDEAGVAVSALLAVGEKLCNQALHSDGRFFNRRVCRSR